MQYLFATGDESPLVYLNAQQRAAALWDWVRRLYSLMKTIWVRSGDLASFRHSANSSTNQQWKSRVNCSVTSCASGLSLCKQKWRFFINYRIMMEKNERVDNKEGDSLSCILMTTVIERPEGSYKPSPSRLVSLRQIFHLRREELPKVTGVPLPFIHPRQSTDASPEGVNCLAGIDASIKGARLADFREQIPR